MPEGHAPQRMQMNNSDDFSATVSSRVNIEYPDFGKPSERVSTRSLLNVMLSRQAQSWPLATCRTSHRRKSRNVCDAAWRSPIDGDSKAALA